MKRIASKSEAGGYRSLWEMLQDPVRDTFRALSFADLETLDCFPKLLRVVNWGSLVGVMK